MSIQAKKVIYWVNNIFFLSAFMFFIVAYGSFALSEINSVFYINFDDSVIAIVLLAHIIVTVSAIISVCLFNKIISKATVILQFISVLLVMLPFIIHIFFSPSNSSEEMAENFILAILHITVFITTLIFMIKDSKKFVD